jgi:hypothetical protein
MKLLITQISAFSSHFISLQSKCFAQYPVLEHAQSIMFPECDRPSCKPIQSNMLYPQTQVPSYELAEHRDQLSTSVQTDNSEFLNQPSNDPFHWSELERRAANLSPSFTELMLVSAETSFHKFGLNYAEGWERQSPDHDRRGKHTTCAIQLSACDHYRRRMLQASDY